MIGVLTGADVAALSRPFPVGVEDARPYYAAAVDVARYAGEPLAVVVARDRYIAEDALELIEVEYEPLEPVLDPAAGEVVSERSFSYGDPDAAFAEADLVVEEPFHFPRWSGTPVECYGVVADWNAAAGSLTAWANFQGPFTLHSVAAGALGLPGSKLRLITPPDSGGSFGIKATVYVYVVLLGLASRHLGIPVRWTEDRLEHLAASAASTARTTTVRPASRPPASCSRSLRRRRGRRARTSAPPSRPRSTGCTARSPARTASGTSPPGTASCSQTAARPASTAASAARSSTSPSSGRWRSPRGGSASTRPSCGAGT